MHKEDPKQNAIRDRLIRIFTDAAHARSLCAGMDPNIGNILENHDLIQIGRLARGVLGEDRKFTPIMEASRQRRINDYVAFHVRTGRQEDEVRSEAAGLFNDRMEVPEIELRSIYDATSGKNIELVAALELKRVEHAREFIKEAHDRRDGSLKIIWRTWTEGCSEEWETRKRTFQHAKFSPEVITFLSSEENREQLRTRFPQSGFTDGYIDTLLYSPLPTLMPVPMASTALSSGKLEFIPSAGDQ